MIEPRLRTLSIDYLLPFFSGARLEEQARPSTRRQERVAFVSPVSIAFKVNQTDEYRLVITRSQTFLSSQPNRIPELEVIKAFVDTLRDFERLIDSELGRDLLPSLQRRVVAKALVSRSPTEIRAIQEPTVVSAIDQLTTWGEKLYEGAPISAALGFRHTPALNRRTTIQQISAEDFGAVLSNGHDTLLTFNYSGQLHSHEQLSLPQEIPSYCPFRQAAVAEWTTQHERRIAITLNRLGEILIFSDHRLVFARRSSRWHFLTHAPVITQMDVPRATAIRRAIYETCLDASFARTGACIGVVQVNDDRGWQNVVAEADLISAGSSIKTRTLRRVISRRRFQDLDRRLRQEISAIDGATVLSHQGEILAAGAILRIPGGSSGGGRLAAARALSQFGLGIKISQDGKITGFRRDLDQPAFTVM